MLQSMQTGLCLSSFLMIQGALSFANQVTGPVSLVSDHWHNAWALLFLIVCIIAPTTYSVSFNPHDNTETGYYVYPFVGDGREFICTAGRGQSWTLILCRTSLSYSSIYARMRHFLQLSLYPFFRSCQMMSVRAEDYTVPELCLETPRVLCSVVPTCLPSRAEYDVQLKASASEGT